ncbi:MAG: hypothetical protein QXN05_02180 [Acidilobaceae archaeon]
MLKSSIELESWLKYKKSVLEGLLEERLIGYLDPGAEEVLNKLNSPPLLLTTSSCIGRITLVEGEEHWSRKRARVVYKTHDFIEISELNKTLARGFSTLWLKVSGPIIHFRTPRLACAFYALSLARKHGFKHSGVVSRHSRLGYSLELMSSIQMIVPLRLKGVDLFNESKLEILVSEANALFRESRKRLTDLSQELSETPGLCGLNTLE